MRSVVFVERVELDFEGNLFANALTLGDVDNDGQSELVVGNVDGQLYVFKGNATSPWAVASNLGMTTCVGIGDVCNKGKNVIITVSAEGLCHIFDLETIKKSKEVDVKVQKDAKNQTEFKGPKDAKVQRDVKAFKDANQKDPKGQKELKATKDNKAQPGGKVQSELRGHIEAKSQPEVKGQAKPFELYPCHTQHLPANTKVLLIKDIDGDGKVELVVGHTDRKVRAYTWEDRQPQQPGTAASATAATANNDSRSSLGWKFVLRQKWDLQGQVGSLSLSRHTDGSPKLVVSQPGCNYAELLCNWVEGQDGLGNQSEPYVKFHPISSRRARNSNVSTEIVANIRLEDDTKELKPYPDRLALCTLDGTLMMIEDDKILWSLLVDHQLFAVTKLDINLPSGRGPTRKVDDRAKREYDSIQILTVYECDGKNIPSRIERWIVPFHEQCDGRDEVVFCAWDGQTYIVDHGQEVVRFQLEENAAAFTAGQYSAKGQNMPCLVYVTFTKQIYIYWNVCLPRIPSASLQDMLASNEDVQEQLRMIDFGECTRRKLQQLVQWSIYGSHNKTEDKK